MKPKEKPHYVNNAQFSTSVVDYVQTVRKAKKANKKIPIVPDYIAECFLKIAEGLSHKSNFVRYTYREEMVMDAVENCLKAIENYNIELQLELVNQMRLPTLHRFLGMLFFVGLKGRRSNKISN